MRAVLTYWFCITGSTDCHGWTLPVDREGRYLDVVQVPILVKRGMLAT